LMRWTAKMRRALG